MKEVYIGKIVNTHGLKGELRILSTFSHKELVFKPDFSIYVEGKSYTITHYRTHKNYDMVTLLGYDNIDDVLFLKGKDVYAKREDIKGVVLDSDLLGFQVLSQKGNRGQVIGIQEGVTYSYLQVEKEEKTYLIPKVDAFIKKIDLEKQEIEIEEIEGLLDEN